MSQKLIMPYPECIILAGYKIPAYVQDHGYAHFGIDLFSWWAEDKKAQGNILASGDGKVIATGWDKNVGYVVVIVYEDVYLRKTGKARDLAARYYHMESVAVKAGDRVKAGDLLGVEGKTQTSGYHCHLELDTDVNYPTWSPQVSAGGNIIIKGVDSTLNPSEVLYRKRGQVVKPCTAANKPGQNKWTADWNTAADLSIPELPEDDGEGDTASLRQQVLELTAQLRQETAEKENILHRLRELVEEYGETK